MFWPFRKKTPSPYSFEIVVRFQKDDFGWYWRIVKIDPDTGEYQGCEAYATSRQKTKREARLAAEHMVNLDIRRED